MSCPKHFLQISLVSLLALITSTEIYAARPGYYLGGQVGWGSVHDAGLSEADMSYSIEQALDYPNFTITSFNGTTSDTGFVWRVYGGYQIGYNWALEIGWSQYPRLPVDANATGVDSITGDTFAAGTSSGIFKLWTFDAYVKYIYPLPWICNTNVFIKLGGAWVTAKTTPQISVTEPDFVVYGEDVLTPVRVFPAGSIGIAYDIRNDISADLSYTHVQKVGHVDQLGSLDNVMIGMALHFG